jgi:predicted RNA-binding protein with TRAM domain
MSREGTEGVARIGGKVTLIRGTVKGDVAVVQVTSVSRSIARAELVELLKKGTPAQSSTPLKDVAGTVAAAVKTLAGSEQDTLYRGTVEDVGSKGDGIVRVDGKVVFIPGAVKGDSITFRIVETREKYNRGELVSRDQPETGAEKDNAEEVTVGREYEVTVAEKDRKNPDKNGVTRINGLVVFIPGTQPGEKVRIRITDRAPRFARAIVLERLE